MKELHAFPMKSNYSSVAYNLAVLGGSGDKVDLVWMQLIFNGVFVDLDRDST